MKTNVLTTLTAFLLLCGSTSQAAPPELGNRKINIAFKEAKAGNVFRILSNVAGGRPIVVSACASEKRAELRLINVPAALAFDTLVSQLGLTWRVAPDAIHVSCLTEEPDSSLDVFERRVSLDVRDADAAAALEFLARAAGLAGSDWQAGRSTVTMAFTDVRLSTALQALIETAGLERVQIVGDRLVATDVSRPDQSTGTTTSPLERIRRP